MRRSRTCREKEAAVDWSSLTIPHVPLFNISSRPTLWYSSHFPPPAPLFVADPPTTTRQPADWRFGQVPHLLPTWRNW